MAITTQGASYPLEAFGPTPGPFAGNGWLSVLGWRPRRTSYVRAGRFGGSDRRDSYDYGG